MFVVCSGFKCVWCLVWVVDVVVFVVGWLVVDLLLDDVMVLFGDLMGEFGVYYVVVDIVFIGGSLLLFGG